MDDEVFWHGHMIRVAGDRAFGAKHPTGGHEVFEDPVPALGFAQFYNVTLIDLETGEIISEAQPQ